MGDGEFQGGGSVKWSVNNSDGESGGGDKYKCKGRDKDPKGPGAMFRVLVNGQLAVQVPVQGTTIKVDWGSSDVAPIASSSIAPARKVRRAKGSK